MPFFLAKLWFHRKYCPFFFGTPKNDTLFCGKPPLPAKIHRCAPDLYESCCDANICLMYVLFQKERIENTLHMCFIIADDYDSDAALSSQSDDEI